MICLILHLLLHCLDILLVLGILIGQFSLQLVDLLPASLPLEREFVLAALVPLAFFASSGQFVL